MPDHHMGERVARIDERVKLAAASSQAPTEVPAPAQPVAPVQITVTESGNVITETADYVAGVPKRIGKELGRALDKIF